MSEPCTHENRKTHLDLDRPQIFTDILWNQVRLARRSILAFERSTLFFFFFDAQRGLLAGKLIRLELLQQRQDLEVGQKRRSCRHYL